MQLLRSQYGKIAGMSTALFLNAFDLPKPDLFMAGALVGMLAWATRDVIDAICR